MSVITILQHKVKRYPFGGDTATLRIYTLEAFETSDGQTIQASGKGTNQWDKEIACTVADEADTDGRTQRVVTIPEFDIDATTDSPDNAESAAYGAYFVNPSGAEIWEFQKFDRFKVPHTATPTTWGAIRIFNAGGGTPVEPSENTYTDAQVDALVVAARSRATHTGTQLAASISDFAAAAAAAVADVFVGEQGDDMYGSLRVLGLASPLEPDVVVMGTPGATSRYYWIVARDAKGNRTMQSEPHQITTGAAVLGVVDFDRVSWTAVSHGFDYEVLVFGADDFENAELLGTTALLTMDNIGQATTAYAVMDRNETADLTVGRFIAAEGSGALIPLLNAEYISGVSLSDLVRKSVAAIIPVQHSFSPAAPAAPFALGANALNQLVAGLNADQLDGLDSLAFVKIATAQTITARHTINPGSVGAAFILGANATSQLIAGLNADMLDGLDSADLVTKATAGTITARHTFNPGSALSPFILGANALAQLVTGLNAEYVGGQTLANLDGRFINTTGDVMTGNFSLGNFNLLAGIVGGGSVDARLINEDSTGSFTLPAASGRNIEIHFIKNLAGTTRTVTPSSGTIEGAANYTIAANGGIIVYASGSDWRIIAKF